MGNNSNDRPKRRKVGLHATICLPKEVANLQATSQLLSQSLCLEKFADSKMGLKLN